MKQSKEERRSHLTQIIGTSIGRLHVLAEYKRAAGIAPDATPPGAISFSVMIERIVTREFPF
jgi:hypothetical protein